MSDLWRTGDFYQETIGQVFCSHKNCQRMVDILPGGKKSCGHGYAQRTHPDHEPAGIEESKD